MGNIPVIMIVIAISMLILFQRKKKMILANNVNSGFDLNLFGSGFNYISINRESRRFRVGSFLKSKFQEFDLSSISARFCEWHSNKDGELLHHIALHIEDFKKPTHFVGYSKNQIRCRNDYSRLDNILIEEENRLEQEKMDKEISKNQNFGDIKDSVIQIGDNNTVTINSKVNEPEILAELNSLRDIISLLSFESKNKVNRALDDITDELQNPEPDKDEIGEALERVLKYIEKTDAFIDEATKIYKPIKNIVSWLGDSWLRILDRFKHY